MGIIDYLLVALLAAYTVFVALWLIRRRRQGKTCCGGSCGTCGGSCSSCSSRCASGKKTEEK